MDTESLHTLSAAVLGLGVVVTGLGGFGLYYSSRAERGGGAPQRASTENELRAKLAGLQRANEELQERLRLARQEREKQPEQPAARTPARNDPAQTSFAGRPLPIAVKTPPPPALVEWAGSPLLEEMIESSIAAEPAGRAVLSERQRLTITGILCKYTDRSIAIHSVAGDDAGFNFAWALKAAFVEAGWRVAGVEQVPYANPPAGLFITSGAASSPEEAIIPHEALTTAGFAVSRCVDSNLKGDKTVLLVGAACAG